MEQAIQAAFGGRGESKASTKLLKIIGTASGKGKVRDNQSGKGEEDLNDLVPFLQHLNQQLSRINKYSDAAAANTNGEKITLEQAMSLFPGDITEKELQQALASFTETGDIAKADQGKNGQLEIPIDALLKEMDLLEKNLAEGSNPEAKSDFITSLLDNELKTVNSNSENEQKIIIDKNGMLNQSGGMILENGEKKLFVEDESSPANQAKITGTDFKNVTFAKPDEEEAIAVNPQTLLKEQAADSEIKIPAPEKEKQPVLKSDERTLQPEKIIFQEAQLSGNAADKIPANLTAVKEENKTSKDILPSESGNEDHAIFKNSRLSMQETKESLISKDNLRFAQEQYSNTANANAGNKVQTDAMQTIFTDASGKIKAEQKGKTISAEKRNEEISLSPVNAAGSGSVKTEKNSSISPVEIISQVTNEIKETAANDGGRVKIILNPPSLGKLEMDVTVRNGKVEVVLVADNKDVQQTLNTHIDKLKGSLQSQGLTIERCDVFMQDKREEYQQNFSQHAFYQQDRSGQESNSRQDNPEEKINAKAIISERPVNVLRVSTDNISLFA
jgi:flagellar hook-length control protein FliK